MMADDVPERVDADGLYTKVAELEDWLDEAVPATPWMHGVLDDLQDSIRVWRRTIGKELDRL